VFGIGSGGAVVGRRADLIIADDLLRGREEAYSESARNKLFDWYASDLLTRLKPGGRIVLISTIWHEDDLFSRLARSGRYEIVRLTTMAATPASTAFASGDVRMPVIARFENALHISYLS
jgi:hypothetical protein